MNKSEGEIELIRAFKKGDIKAFEKLFQKYHKKLYVFLFHLLHSKEDAEEIVQEAFIKIWEKREEFKEEHSFSSFLFTIAKNSFLNLNRKKINLKVFEDHLDFVEITSTVKTDDYVLFKETKEIINIIINDLPPKRKEIFLLRRIDGLSRNEIAEKLGISITTVDSQLTKANIYLKDQLKKYSVLLLILFLS
ncbi:MAG: RNA polymerase sigma factor [Draconibacterium sp.]